MERGRMEKARITVAYANEQAAEKIKYALQHNGYSVSEICTSGSETLRRVRTIEPDILLINFDMPDTTGLEDRNNCWQRELMQRHPVCNKYAKRFLRGSRTRL